MSSCAGVKVCLLSCVHKLHWDVETKIQKGENDSKFSQSVNQINKLKKKKKKK